MASRAHGWQPVARDREILAVLELLPLTAEQLLKESECFSLPFTDIDDLRRRLRKLGCGNHLPALDLVPTPPNELIDWNLRFQEIEKLMERCRRKLRRVGKDTSTAGFIQAWPLVIEKERGSLPLYHKVTRKGSQHLRQFKDEPTSKKARQPQRTLSFRPIGISLHTHTHALSDFIVHTRVGAHRLGVEFQDPYPENAYSVIVGKESIKLDWRFSLPLEEPRTFNVELDNSTETELSDKDTDTIARKIRLLVAHDAQFRDARDPKRAITLFVTARSRLRLTNILTTAQLFLRDRALIYGVYLPDYLDCKEPLTTPCFLDHRDQSVALLPERVIERTLPPVRQLAPSVSV